MVSVRKRGKVYEYRFEIATVEELKNAYVDVKHIDYGSADFSDNSKWNYKRPVM